VRAMVELKDRKFVLVMAAAVFGVALVVGTTMAFADDAPVDADGIARPVKFSTSSAFSMTRYLERAKVPPITATDTLRVYSIESASCSPETHPSDWPGGGDVTTLTCRLYTAASEYRDHTSYEGGIELITILSGVTGGGYTEYTSAVDILCTSTRASAQSPWSYACKAGKVDGVTDTSSDN